MHNKYQEAIRRLKLDLKRGNCDFNVDEYIATLQELVDKQTPVGIDVIKGVNHKGETIIKRYECPDCKYVIYNWLCKRCDKCGKLLDWKGYNS